MKLLRVGDKGKEKPAVLDKNNKIRDISSHIKDLNPDYLNFECKAARIKSGAKITLSSKVATYPEKSSKFLLKNFGNVKPPKNLRRFYPTLRANDNDALVYERNYMGLKIERDTKKIRMIIKDLDKKIINDEIYWSFDDVYSSTIKLKDMLISEITEEKKETTLGRPSDLHPGKFNSPHGMTIDKDGNIYVAEWLIGGRMTKLRRTR